MRLQQGQIWQKEEVFLRIVHLAWLEVQYKSLTNIHMNEGTHHKATKKEFCRLIKGARLLP